MKQLDASQRVGHVRGVRGRSPAAGDVAPLVGIVVVLAALQACGDPEGDTTGSSDGTPASLAMQPRRGPLCPSCVPRDVAGTETSDFSGQEPACTGDRAPLPADADLTAIEQLREAYAGRLELSLRWEPGQRSGSAAEERPAFYQASPSGYEPSTRVSIDVALGETEYFVGRPNGPPDASLDCPDWLQVPATLEVSTADGALEVVAYGGFATRPGWRGNLRALGDLADAVGTLDLHLDPNQQYRGGVSIEVNAMNEGKRGSFELFMSVEGSDDLDYPLFSTFPDDACGTFAGSPASADAPLAWANGRSAAQLLGDWRTALGSVRSRAVWNDCSPVDVSFELATPSEVCVASPIDGAEGVLRFDATSRLVTSDGRVDMALPRGFASSTWLSLDTVDPVPQVPAAEFAERTGILGVEPGASPWLEAAASVRFDRDGAGLASSGYVRVGGIDCGPEQCAYVYPERLDWPPESRLPPPCP